MAKNPNPSRKRARSLTDTVVAAISEQIRSGRYRPGSKLPTESAIMGEQKVSRTVVREAISRLQAAGLVVTHHGIGTFVKDGEPAANVNVAAETIFSALDAMAVLELRMALETEAAALAALRHSDADLARMRELVSVLGARDLNGPERARRADFDFHLLIASASGNTYFRSILDQLGEAMLPRARVDHRYFDDGMSGDDMQVIYREHVDICSAIGRRDADSARAAMYLHLANSRERLQEACRRMEDQEPDPGNRGAGSSNSSSDMNR